MDNDSRSAELNADAATSDPAMRVGMRVNDRLRVGDGDAMVELRPVDLDRDDGEPCATEVEVEVDVDVEVDVEVAVARASERDPPGDGGEVSDPTCSNSLSSSSPLSTDSTATLRCRCGPADADRGPPAADAGRGEVERPGVPG